VSEDFRYSLRLLASRPAFTGVIVLALGIGIGINTALFSVVNALLLAPLPYDRPLELVEIEQARPELPVEDLRRAESFTSAGAFAGRGFAVGPAGESRQVFGMEVTAGLFRVLGVRPARGRLFDEGEDGQPVIIVSSAYWRSNPADVLVINGEKHQVVGVLPEDFTLTVRDGTVFVPLRVEGGRAVARLKPGATIAQAQSEVGAMRPGSRPPLVRPVDQAFRSGDASTVLFLQAAVALVLLITCANVGNLLLVSSDARRKEFAIRAALGAGRFQIVRRLLVESALLALGGAAAGLLLSWWSMAWTENQLPGNLIRRLRIAHGLAIDGRVLGFTAGIAVAAVLLFGLAPAISAWRLDLVASLRGGSPRRQRAGALLAASEVALSLMLLIGAGLTVKSLLGLEKRKLGFNPDHVLRAAVDLLPARYPQPGQRAAAVADIVRRVAAMPGVESVGAFAPQFFPFGGPRVRGAVFEIEGRTGEQPRAEVYAANPAYLRAVRIPLLRGRWFAEQDDLAAEPVAVLSDLVVRRYWNGADPIGRRVRLAGEWAKVVGIVGDVRNPIGLDWQPTTYRPIAQTPSAGALLFVRTTADPMALAAPIRRLMRAFDPTAQEVRTADLERAVADYLGPQRFTTSLLSSFAVLGLLLAALGVYGVMRHWVATRIRDIGIRVALGAGSADVMLLVLGRAGRALAAGVALGTAGALALQKVIAAELIDVSPSIPP
jgi:predicted permease